MLTFKKKKKKNPTKTEPNQARPRAYETISEKNRDIKLLKIYFVIMC